MTTQTVLDGEERVGGGLRTRLFQADVAVFSLDRRYRYRLRRQWDPALPSCGFVMLNPSTATEVRSDPTIRRCVGFARSWGYGAIEVGNLFALRSRDPAALRGRGIDPVGVGNDAAIAEIVDRSDLVVAAWGVHGELRQRGERVFADLRRSGKLAHLGLTKGGQPRHPLYAPASCPLVRVPRGGP